MTQPAPSAALPPCPITGRPALRRVHGVAASTLRGLWRHGQGVDVDRLFDGRASLGLYESDCGLMFFDPLIAGDGRFYADYYARQKIHLHLSRLAATRSDFLQAASHIPRGARVLDVGSGSAAFRQHLAHADYRGLDPYADHDDPAIHRESLEDHAAGHAGEYDVVCAFHVIEHLATPLQAARLMARLLKPGGLLILAAPLHPSPLTEIPNLPLNLPPHHLSWWNPRAFSALAGALGLEVREACTLPPSPHAGLVYWIHRLLPLRSSPPPDERYVAHRLGWHLSLLVAYGLARCIAPVMPLPAGARPIDAFLVARKPA